MPLTLEMCQKLLQASEAKAKELEIRVSIALVDEAGHLKALYRMDGAMWITTDIAQAMAYTAAAFRAAGADLVGYADRPWFRSLTLMNEGRILPAGGGIPVRVGRELVGAIGVSGGSDAQDRECSEAGLAAIAQP